VSDILGGVSDVKGRVPEGVPQRIAGGVGGGALTCVASKGIVGSSEMATDQRKKEFSEKEFSEKVMHSPEVPIRFENPEGAPVTILNADVKVISRAEYYQLMLLAKDQGPDSFDEYVTSPTIHEYTTFPTITLFNNTDQRVIGFELRLTNTQITLTQWVVAPLTILPHSDYTFKARNWVLHKHLPTSASDEPIIEGEMLQPRMWFPGRARDLVVKVREVKFEDGSRWRSNVVNH
jgi:hypothetical protein